MNPIIRDRQETLEAFVAGRRERTLFQVDLPPVDEDEVPEHLRGPKGEIIRDGELQLRRQLWANERRMAWPGPGDDWVPTLHPYMGTGVLASAFGAETAFPDEEDPWTRPFVRGPDEALELARPAADAGLLGEVIRRTRRMRQVAGPDYPIRVTDIQSPLDTALLIWDQADLLTSMVLAPKAVHHLLDLIADLTIEFVERQRDAAGEAFAPLHWPGTWWPLGRGLGVSDDILPLIGPKEYAEFGPPYLARLSKAFDGVMVHSCGNFTHNLEVLAGVPGLRMVNFGATEQPVRAAAAALPDEVVLSTHLGLNKDPHFETATAFVEHALDEVDDPRRLWVLAPLDEPTPAAREEMIALLAGRGRAGAETET